MSKHTKSHMRESKGVKFARNLMAFILSLIIATMSISICSAVVFIGSGSLPSVFCNEEYVTSLKDDITTYAHDKCDEMSIPYDSVDRQLSYETIYTIAESYAVGNFGKNPLYTETTYQTKIDILEKELSSDTADMLEKNGFKLSNKQKEYASDFGEDIAQYAKNKTEFVFSNKLKTAVNMARVALYIASAVLLVFAVVLALIIITTGSRKYRGVRSVAYAFEASFSIQLSAVAAVEIIKKFKTLYIFPLYLRESVMSYISHCETALCVAALISLMMSLVTMVIVWCMKRNDK